MNVLHQGDVDHCPCEGCVLVREHDEQIENDLNDPNVEWFDRDLLEEDNYAELLLVLTKYPIDTPNGIYLREWFNDKKIIEQVDNMILLSKKTIISS